MCIKICVQVTFLRGCVVFIITWVFCLFDWLMKTGSHSIPQANLELTLFPMQAMNSQQSSFLSFLGVWPLPLAPNHFCDNLPEPSLLLRDCVFLDRESHLWLLHTVLEWTSSTICHFLIEQFPVLLTESSPPPPPPGPKGEHSPGVSFAV